MELIISLLDEKTWQMSFINILLHVGLHVQSDGLNHAARQALL